MYETKQPKILIVTAAFGDGHNSAARGLTKTLEGKAEVMLKDPCAIGNPVLNVRMRQAYQACINHAPTLWNSLYKGSDKVDFSKPKRYLPQMPEKTLHHLLETFQPDALVTTYPIYPYYAERSFKTLPRIPIFTVVTDSININKSWVKSPSDHFLVTDDYTRQILIDKEQLPEEKIHSLGFAVNPVFTELEKIPSTDKCNPFKVLYFPTGQKPQLRRVMRGILNSDCPELKLTVVLGRHFRKLYSRALEIKKEYPDRVEIKGWTKKVPQLVSSHHLVVGKAGGATTHECISAETPMLIHYLLPGQEAGNLDLLEKIGAGALADSPEKLTQHINKLSNDDFALWREWKRNLSQNSRPDGAFQCVDFILQQLAK